jgi:CheY-like chemotaxis protein
MVYGIIHQAGGAIEVESKVGFGTQFKILFPRISKTDSQENSVDNHGVPRGQETILLAEDEEAVRRLTTTALSMLGYKILQADSGRTAIEMAESYPGTIDLLLTDVVMPELGGRMLADAVRKLRPNVRVLYMSGYMDDAVVRQGIETSKDAFIQKPLTQSTLAKKVRLVLDAES